MRPSSCALETDTLYTSVLQELKPRHLGVLWNLLDSGPLQINTLESCVASKGTIKNSAIKNLFFIFSLFGSGGNYCNTKKRDTAKSQLNLEVVGNLLSRCKIAAHASARETTC